VAVSAQESELDSLKRQLKENSAAFQKFIEEQRRVIDAMSNKIEVLERQQAAVTNQQAELKKLVQAPGTNVTGAASAAVTPAAPWSPTQPIRLFGGSQNYLNVSFDGLFAAGTSTADDIESLQLGGHDPKQRGFTVQNLETTFEGKVDPYFRGQANIVLQIDPDGETIIEAEEAYLETMSLPWNLQLKAGQFFTEFGRLNPTHPHTWDFVDQPLVNGRFFGEDGLRNAGGRLSWLVPTPFYSELFLTIQNSHGETATSFRDEHEGEPFLGRPSSADRVKAFNDLLFVPRYAASFNLSDAQTLLLGASAAFGPERNGQRHRHADLRRGHVLEMEAGESSRGFPFVSWQTEAMLRRFEAGAFSEDLDGDGAIGPGDAI
jgi:hypothetical protein